MDAEELLESLRDSVRATIEGRAEVAVAYSGGVDSSIIASLAGERAEVKCYSCAMEGSPDSRNVRSYAEADGLSLEVMDLPSDDLKRYVGVASRIMGSTNPMQVAYTIPVLVVVDGTSEELLLVGSGADELFGGYAKYESAKDPRSQMDADLAKMLVEKEALTAFARDQGKTIGYPFATQAMIELAGSMPLERKLNESGRKIILREVARLLGLSAHDRPKKAAQYSSGVLREMERMARSERVHIADWVRARSLESEQRSA